MLLLLCCAMTLSIASMNTHTAPSSRIHLKQVVDESTFLLRSHLDCLQWIVLLNRTECVDEFPPAYSASTSSPLCLCDIQGVQIPPHLFHLSLHGLILIHSILHHSPEMHSVEHNVHEMQHDWKLESADYPFPLRAATSH